MSSRTALILEREKYWVDKVDYKGLVTCEYRQDNVFDWLVYIYGPKGSIWEGSTLLVQILFDQYFNIKPPKVFFITVPFHPNICSMTGKPCISILDNEEEWSDKFRISELIFVLINILVEPMLVDPVNIEAADLFKKSPRLYQQLARDSVVASKRLLQGASIFEHHHSVNTGSNSELDSASTTNNEGKRKSVESKTLKNNDDMSIPVKQLSFDEYYENWCSVATALPSVRKIPKPPKESYEHATEMHIAQKKRIEEVQQRMKEFVARNRFLKPGRLEEYLEKQHKILYGTVIPFKNKTKKDDVKHSEDQDHDAVVGVKRDLEPRLASASKPRIFSVQGLIDVNVTIPIPGLTQNNQIDEISSTALKNENGKMQSMDLDQPQQRKIIAPAGVISGSDPRISKIDSTTVLIGNELAGEDGKRNNIAISGFSLNSNQNITLDGRTQSDTIGSKPSSAKGRVRSKPSSAKRIPKMEPISSEDADVKWEEEAKDLVEWSQTLDNEKALEAFDNI